MSDEEDLDVGEETQAEEQKGSDVGETEAEESKLEEEEEVCICL